MRDAGFIITKIFDNFLLTNRNAYSLYVITTYPGDPRIYEINIDPGRSIGIGTREPVYKYSGRTFKGGAVHSMQKMAHYFIKEMEL